jgi:hypothetical protein
MSVSNKEIQINERVKQGWPLSPTLSDIFIGAVIRQWLDALTKKFKIHNTVLNTKLFADDLAIFSESEANFQRAVSKLENILNVFTMRISTMRTETMAFQEKST